MSRLRLARRRVEISVGASVRIVRELQELSQNKLATLTGIPQTTISAIENGRVRLGVERAKALASTLKCHPVFLAFSAMGVRRAISGLTMRCSVRHLSSRRLQGLQAACRR